MSSTADDQRKQLINEFLIETEEVLATINRCLTHIEKTPNDKEALNEMYRAIHTMKGSASFLQFCKLEQLSHAIESVLDKVRNDEIKLNTTLCDELFTCIDAVSGMAKSLGSDGTEGSADIENLISKLEAAASEKSTPSHEQTNLEDDVSEQRKKLVNPRAEQLEAENDLAASLNAATEEFSAQLEEAKHELSVNSPALERDALTDDDDTKKSPTEQIVRVNVSLLDKIMNAVGELVLARNQIVQFANSQDLPELNRLATSLNVITTELQSDIMVTRMQPIGNILLKYERVMRDLCRATDKKIRLHIEGRDTELDRTVLEAIKDPISHLIRNAADHGIEAPSERQEAGKLETGTISIKAYHEAGQVTIEIRDDGKGLNKERILEKAIQKGIVAIEQAENYTDKQIYNLIFQPGFSTKEEVTNISGRGVGMDVVQSNIEKIGGQVDITSEPGEGTTIKLRIPLTLAIIPAMIVKEADHSFAIPQINLVELVRVDSKSSEQIEQLQGSEFYRLRGELIPIVRLKKVLSLKAEVEKSEVENIVVLTAEGYQLGLIVDSILDTQEIVVKPLSPELKALHVFAGATIMGDGHVALILDALGLAHHCQLNLDRSQQELNETIAPQILNYESQEMLLFSLSDRGNYCAPLCLVNRLEEVKCSEIEKVGNQLVIRYRDQVMPLYDLNLQFGLDPIDLNSEVMSVLVAHKRGNYTGLLVNEILDIALVEEEVKHNFGDQHGLMGTIFIQDKTYSVVDVIKALKFSGRVAPTPTSEPTTSGSMGAGQKILLAEDSPFYRKVSKTFLESKGFQVMAVNNGSEAYEYLLQNNVDLVISDIEMPITTGLELVEKIRAREELKNLPVIALTTRSSEQDREKGFKAGFTEYLEKFEEEEVIKAVESLIGSRAA